jgi:hypothetical protein
MGKKADGAAHAPSLYHKRCGCQAICEVNNDQNQVILLFVGHRRSVYDDFTKML